MLRLIILFIVVFLIIRFLLIPLRRLLRALAGGNARRRVPSNPNVIDEMKPCAHCGTYAPTALALAKKELYFCSEQCHVAYLKRERA